jgi:diguanylate cyclase (GGDEF)-like protein
MTMLAHLTCRCFTQPCSCRFNAPAQIASQPSEALPMQYVFESGSTAVCVLDQALGIIMANDLARRLLTMGGDGRVIGRSLVEFIPDAEALLASTIDAAFAGEESTERRVQWRGRHYHLSFGTMQDEVGGASALVVTAVDVTRYVAVEQKLRQAVRRLVATSRQDHLTGLLNRRGLEVALHGELRRCRRDGTPLSVVAVDIDIFKAYNDSWGHPRGDECLRLVSASLTSCLRRAGDRASRYGGEEFILVLPNSNLQGASAIAETCLRAVADLNLSHPVSSAGRVTVSIGVATVQPVESADVSAEAAAVLSAADRALYRAKRSGRARIEVADDGPTASCDLASLRCAERAHGEASTITGVPTRAA